MVFLAVWDVDLEGGGAGSFAVAGAAMVSRLPRVRRARFFLRFICMVKLMAWPGSQRIWGGGVFVRFLGMLSGWKYRFGKDRKQ